MALSKLKKVELKQRESASYLISTTRYNTLSDLNNIFELACIDHAELCTQQKKFDQAEQHPCSGAKYSCYSHPLLALLIPKLVDRIMHIIFSFSCIKSC